MTGESDLRELFHTTFDALHAAPCRPAAPVKRRMALRPAVAAALCLTLACGSVVGGSATRALRYWPSLFGGQITETDPPKDATFAADQNMDLPKGCVSYMEFEQPTELQPGTGANAGVYLLDDGTLYLRRADAADEEMTDLFDDTTYNYTYTPRDGGAEGTATVQGRCTLDYQCSDGTAAVITLTRAQTSEGKIGYLLERSFDAGGAGFVYDHTQVTYDFLWGLKYQVLDPDLLANP